MAMNIEKFFDAITPGLAKIALKELAKEGKVVIYYESPKHAYVLDPQTLREEDGYFVQNIAGLPPVEISEENLMVLKLETN